MVFEFLKWRSTFETHRRGVKKGELTYKRPHAFFDFTSLTEWGKFLVLFLFGGSIVAALSGIFAYFAISAAAGHLVWNAPAFVWLFIGLWILFCLAHLIHSLRFYKTAKLTDVDFVPLDKAEAIGKRVLTMPENLSPTDYNIFYSRFIWADVEEEPYHDVTDWVERIASVQRGGQPTRVGSIGEGIGYAIGEKYAESKIKEIVEMSGGIPSTQEIVKIIQTELVPRYRESLGEPLMRLYLVFLGTQPPILPYDKSTSRSEMRAVASVSDTKDVLNYLKKFAERETEVPVSRERHKGVKQLVSLKPSDVTTDDTIDDYEFPTGVISQWRNLETSELCRIRKVRDLAVGTDEEVDTGVAPVHPVGYVAEAQFFSMHPKTRDVFFIIADGRDTNYHRLEKTTKRWMRENWLKR